MAEHGDRTTDRRRELQALLQAAQPNWRVVVESVTTGGFDGFRIWASRPDDGKRTVVYELTRLALSSAVVAEVAAAVQTAIAVALPLAPAT